jgi:hypothetical protein
MIGYGVALGGGKDSSRLNHLMLKVNQKSAKLIPADVSEDIADIVFQLHISGDIQSYGSTAIEKPRYQKKKRNLVICIILGKEDWVDKSLDEIYQLIFNLSEDALQLMKEFALKKGLVWNDSVEKSFKEITMGCP